MRRPLDIYSKSRIIAQGSRVSCYYHVYCDISFVYGAVPGLSANRLAAVYIQKRELSVSNYS